MEKVLLIKQTEESRIYWILYISETHMNRNILNKI